MSHAASPRIRFTPDDAPWLAVGLYGALALVIGLPLAMIVLWSFSDGWFPPALIPTDFTLDHWRQIVEDRGLAEAAIRSVGIAFTVTLLSGIIALPTAWAMARFPFRMKRAVELFILAPLIVPGLVVAVGVGQLFLMLKLAYTVPGVILVQLIGTLPLMIRLLSASLGTIPEDLLLAARSLGASPLRSMLAVVLPLSVPTLVAGGLITFVESFQEFDMSFIVGAPLVETLPIRLFFYLDGSGIRFTSAAVVSLILLAPVLVIFVIAGRIMRDDVMASGMGKL
ncbi:ABC transporter permease [Kaistia dalseonensis]|uniref:Multiple sugar transport system permease protein/putative spermidine/putrescine transport system permease protein n=1 Tax=Kaistia dalseonensis TaxID=410840 RepID=A0ABU0H9P9_9HYPH|nr:ABC transporter permease [Kaistia dalseonensis]MCX5496384.1 ABC transporter permease [Kaistia dalseonensis]MDQ0439005.1 multiple sugar transport system permease protein/putative spermidine/putrescine transport system permease protein [Kaistia dalseonensis]